LRSFSHQQLSSRIEFPAFIGTLDVMFGGCQAIRGAAFSAYC
jgi:hypothetical protein